MTYYCRIDKEGDEYIAQFPDMTNIVTCGFSLDEALYMAKDALNAVLKTELDSGDSIPEPKYEEGYAIEVEPNIAIAIRLREWRGNDSQSAVAQRLGIKYQSYQRLENPAKSNPTIKTLEKIVKMYGKKLEALIA
jgi:antitoxin HicB